MSELEPLNVVDDRTPEQIREDGDERWPDGRPYIKDGVCCVCESPVENADLHTCLVKLQTPCECEIHELVQEEQKCTGMAYWAYGFDRLTATCDECISNMLERLPDNREWLAPALADIRKRHLKIGARVRIQCLAERGQLGTVYKQWPGQDAWYVRPDRRPADAPGIACEADELDVLL